MTFKTFDQSDVEAWADQNKHLNNDNDIFRTPSKRFVDFDTPITFLTIDYTSYN